MSRGGTRGGGRAASIFDMSICSDPSVTQTWATSRLGLPSAHELSRMS